MFKAAFSKNLEEGTNNGAKIQALISGVKLCKRLACRHIIIEIDSNWVRSNRCNAYYLLDFWDQLQQELSGLFFLISYIYKKGNQIADLLARRGEKGTLQIYMICEELPKEV